MAVTYRSAPRGPISEGVSRLRAGDGGIRPSDVVVGHLVEAATSLGAALSVEQVAEATVREARRAVGADAGSLFVPRGDGRAHVVAAVGYAPEFVERLEEITGGPRGPAADSLRERRALIFPTHRELEEAYPQLVAGGLRRGTLVAWPLLVGERAVGSLLFGYAAEHAFGRDREIVLEALAGQCAQALERVRLYEAERVARAEAERLRAEAELLFELTRAVNRASSIAELYGPALDALERGLSLERASVLLFDPDGVMRFKAWRGLSEEYRRAVEGHSPWGPEEREARPFAVADVLADPTLRPYHDKFEAEGIRSIAFIPLVHEGRLLGKLMLYEREPRTFTERELRLAEAIASQIAQAAARARLFERERESRAIAERHADSMQRLQQLTAQLSGAVDPEDVAEIVIDCGSALVGALRGGLWLVDEDARELRLLRTSGYPPAWVDGFGSLPLERGNLIVDAYLDRAPVWIPSREEYARRYPALEASTREARLPSELAIAAVPLWAGDAAIGALAFTFPGTVRFDEEGRAFLEALAQQTHQAIERARLYRAEQSARAEAEAERSRAAFLAEASALLSASLDYQVTLQKVARLAVPAVADWCTVDVVDESTGAIEPVVIAPAEPALEALAHELRRGLLASPGVDVGIHQVIRTGASVSFQQVDDELLRRVARDPAHLERLREIGVRSCLLVPVGARDRVFGALTLVSAASGRTYRDADLQMAEQLARRIGVAIDNARLYQQAIGAVNLRDEFLSVAGHELKTPLTALLLQSELLLAAQGGGAPARGLSEALNRVQRNARRISTLVDELLDVSRITSGRLELHLEPVDLQELITEVVAREAESSRRVGCTIELDLGEGLVGRWDRLRVEQVVTNLLTNAMKYGAHAPIRIAARRWGDEVRLSVHDQGIGIAAADQARIFERFERSVSSRKFGGLGLGLWIVRKIVDAHHGKIGVVSEPQQGSEFWVELPVSVAAASAPERSEGS